MPTQSPAFVPHGHTTRRLFTTGRGCSSWTISLPFTPSYPPDQTLSPWTTSNPADTQAALQIPERGGGVAGCNQTRPNQTPIKNQKWVYRHSGPQSPPQPAPAKPLTGSPQAQEPRGQAKDGQERNLHRYLRCLSTSVTRPSIAGGSSCIGGVGIDSKGRVMRSIHCEPDSVLSQLWSKSGLVSSKVVWSLMPQSQDRCTQPNIPRGRYDS